ncbi:MAG: DUF302 domain-containing protein [Nitrospiraceae bacterium]|nr:DUF302 domain-containing protein [Nitrospiraceae bacterium]
MMYFIWLVTGLIIGLIIGGITFVYLMQRFMIVAYKMEGTFDEVNEAIKNVIPQSGWSFPIKEWQFYKSQLSKNLTYDNIRDMIMYFVCKPSNANEVLRVDPVLGAIMPCTWAVYETTGGEVYIAKMNIALMSKMYFGTVGEVMREVAAAEKEMLKKIKENLSSIHTASSLSGSKGE